MDSLDNYRRPDQLSNQRMVYYLDGIQGQGRVHSTVGDLLKWDRALKNHTLLPQTAQQEMLTGQALSDTANKMYYGYGVFIGKRDGREYIDHSGSWPGYATNLARYVADDAILIVLSNNESNSSKVSNDLADILFGKTVTLPRKKVAIIVDPAILGRYTGQYELAPKFILTITHETGGLMLQATGQSKVVLLAETETKFYPKAFEAQIEFVKDESGKVTKLMLLQGGRTTEAKKID